jgi:uncharacterized protein YxeA
MKKILALLLTLVLMITLSGCALPFSGDEEQISELEESLLEAQLG